MCVASTVPCGASAMPCTRTMSPSFSAYRASAAPPTPPHSSLTTTFVMACAAPSSAGKVPTMGAVCSSTKSSRFESGRLRATCPSRTTRSPSVCIRTARMQARVSKFAPKGGNRADISHTLRDFGRCHPRGANGTRTPSCCAIP
eukprot:scaffold26045_cov69-Phaeocystis_antarctica.AAC.3